MMVTILTILFSISLALLVYSYLSQRKLYSTLLKVFILLTVLATPIAAQEDIGLTGMIGIPEPLPDGPIVLPQIGQMTGDPVISSVLSDQDQWILSAYQFLGLNNTSNIQLIPGVTA